MTMQGGTVRVLGVPIRFGRLRTAGGPFWIWVVGLCALALAGLWAWRHQWPDADGLVTTGMRDVFLWGLYIQNFIFLVGLSAGGLIVYSSVVLFGAEQFRPLERVAVLQAGVCVLLAMLFVMPDLGNPQRAYWFLKTPNFRSIFVFDFMVLTTYLMLCGIDLWALLSGRMKGRVEFALTVISLPTAIGVHSITAWVLGLVKGRELWHTALMAPLFISSAVSSGLAMLILIAWTLRRVGQLRLPDETLAGLGRLLSVVIVVDLFFMGAELLAVYWPASREPGHAARMDLLTSGRYAPFLLGSIVGGGMIPFALLVSPAARSGGPLLLVASAMVFGGIFVKRAALLVMGFAYSPLGVRGDYWPTLIEWGVTGAVWAVGTLVFTFAVLLLDVGRGHGHQAKEES